jgi:hypothetical protein
MSSPRLHGRLLASRRSAVGRRGATGGWVLLAALLSLLAQGTGLAHLALVSHVQCYEHDALAHAEERTQAPPADETPTPLVGGVPVEAAHSDDHCLAAGLRQREVVIAAPDHTRTPLVAVVDVGSPLAGQTTPAAPVPLILLAPKSSPPARG